MRGVHRTKAEMLPEDDLDPLFSYAKIQPPLVLDEDDDEPALPLKWQKRLKKARIAPEPVAVVECVEPPAPAVLEEDDWLDPPPKIVDTGTTMDFFRVQQQMRQKRLELLHIANQPAPAPGPPMSNIRPIVVKTAESEVERTEGSKVRIFIQDKDGNRKQYAISKTERLERLFNAYANSLQLKSTDLVFKFDGELLASDSTLKQHDIEDEDQIEVFHKATKR